MNERLFEQTLQRQQRIEASAIRLKSHLAKVVSEGAPADLIVKIGRKTAYCEDLSKRLGEQAIREEAGFYVSRYVSPSEQPQQLVGIVTAPKADEREKARVEPQTSVKPKAPEPSTVEEEPKLPKIVIDGRESTVSVDGGEPVRLNKGYIKLLKNLAKSGEKGLDSLQVVTAFSIRKGAPVASEGSQIIHNLRVKIEADPRTPRVVLREGARYEPIYKLNGELSFTQETAETQRARESRNVYEITLPDGLVIPVMGEIRAKLARKLVEATCDSPVSSKDLSKAAYGTAKKTSMQKLNSQVSLLRNYLDQYSWEVKAVYGLKKGKGKIAHYFLQSTKGETEKTNFSLKDKEVLQSRQDALNLLISNPNVEIEEIIKTLGPAKNERELTRPQALFAMNRAVNILYVRVVKEGTATEQEIELWKSIKAGTKREDDKESLGTFKAGMKSWFSRSKTVTKEDLTSLVQEHESRIDKLSADEAGIIAALLISRNGTKLNIYSDGKPEIFEIESKEMEVMQKLVAGVSFRNGGEMSESKRDEYVQMRAEALKKVERILKADNAVDIINAHQNGDIELLLMLLYFQDEAISGMIYEFLNDTPDKYWELEKWRFQRVWREWTPGRKLERQKASGSNEADDAITTEPATPEGTEVSAGLGQPSGGVDASDTQDLVGYRRKNVVLSPQEAQIFAEAVSRIQAESSGASSLTQAQVSRTFHYMTRDTLKQAISNGFVSPRREGNKNIYAREDIVFLHALRVLGNQLAKSERKKLRKKVRSFLGTPSKQ